MKKVHEITNIKEFRNLALTLKPEDVRCIKISERDLKRKKAVIREGKILLSLYTIHRTNTDH
jgi:hypothetical protein